MTPQIIGVLDLMDGVAVRAVGGRRDEYRPVCSRLCESGDPRRIAEAFRDRYGIDSLYVADLDAILERGSNVGIIAELSRAGFRLAVDAGLRHAADVERLIDLEIQTIVAGLETLVSPAVLDELIARVGRQRLAFSLDLAGGKPLTPASVSPQETWPADTPLSLAQRAVESGVEHLIVLDLHAIGRSNGPATQSLCRELRTALPPVTLWTGGGVRTAIDVRRLGECGADGVLVASALHDATL